MIAIKKRILIVEDEPSVLKFMRLRLAHEGYLVFCAEDGEEALREAQVDRPDLILLDLQLPKLDGYLVCRRLREQPSTARIPIIVVTASEEQYIRLADRCVELGIQDAIKKPFRTQELLEKIDKVFGKEKRTHE